MSVACSNLFPLSVQTVNKWNSDDKIAPGV